jgi:hypothetical protein
MSEPSDRLTRRYHEQIPAGKAGQPSDIANLASPLARYITPHGGDQFLPAGKHQQNLLGTGGTRVLKLVLL